MSSSTQRHCNEDSRYEEKATQKRADNVPIAFQWEECLAAFGGLSLSCKRSPTRKDCTIDLMMQGLPCPEDIFAFISFKGIH